MLRQHDGEVYALAWPCGRAAARGRRCLAGRPRNDGASLAGVGRIRSAGCLRRCGWA